MAARARVRITRRWVLPALLSSLVLVVVAAGAAAAIETDTVASYWRGMLWAISLITTVGFIGNPPSTTGGAALAAGLMVVGFILLSMVSAYLAALFVREDEAPHDAREVSNENAILAALDRLETRMASLERELTDLNSGPRTASQDEAGAAGS